MFNAIGRSASLYLDLNGVGYNYLDNDRLFVRNSPGTNTILFVSGSGNVGMGTSTPNTRLDVNGNVTITGSANNSLLVRGSGATFATYAIRAENSAGTNIARFRNDGYIEFGTGGFSSMFGASYGFLFDGGGTRQITFTLNSANGPRISAGSIGLNVSIGQSSQVISIGGNANLGGNAITQVVDLGGTYTTSTSNTTMDMMALSPAFVLTSSLAAPPANILRMGFSINHTIGSQIIHGINFTPTLTSAYNFRAFNFGSSAAYSPNSAVTNYIWSLISPNITATANNQSITGLDITLSGSNGAFTGVRRSALNLTAQNSTDMALNAIGAVVITGSLIVTGGITGSLSGSSGGGTTNTGSLLVTASANLNVITFTKGDGSTFPITVDTGSGGGGGGSAFPFTGSAGITGSLSVVGPTTLRGAGATSATNALRVENSAGTPMLLLRNDLTVQAQSIVLPGSSMTQFPVVSASLGVLAMGNGTTEALSTNSIALGNGCKARAAYSIAAGFENKTYGLSSVSMGNNNEASGSYSIAFGDSNTAKGLSSFSVGNQNMSSGSYSITMGSQNTANGLRSMAIGEGNSTPGTRGVAIGFTNTIVGNQDITIGANNWANGSNSMVMGTYLSASGASQIVTGQYNRTSSAATFIIGNGINVNNRRNIVEVAGTTFMITGSLVTSGSLFSSIQNTIHVVTSSVGIGTSTPSERLHVAAVGSGTDVPLYVSGKDTKGGTGYLDFLKVENTAGGTPTPKKFFRISTVGSWEVINDAYNQVIMSFEDSGNMTIAGTLTQNSDVSLKTNIQTIPNALEKTLQLRGVEYDRISTNKHEIGLIAQEVEQIFPELVSESNGIKAVAYANLVGVLIESIKELKQEINDLREQINTK